jgi:probable rRNA maturation factor
MAECGPSPESADLLAGTRLEVDVVRHDGDWDEVSDQMLAKAARAALAEASALPAGDYELTILLTGDEEMRALSRTWRGKDAPTNVLSFPVSDALSGPGLLGDVVLAYETIHNEAGERNLALADHASHLVVHGVLHLVGFDHADDVEAERMEAFERKALASLGIADPYVDQPYVSELLS